MRLRKDVNVYLHDPGATFFHVVVELENVPGALQGLLGVLRNMKLSVLSSFSSVDSSAKTGVWSAFVEDSGRTASELKKVVSSAPHVVDSVVISSKEGYLVDGVHFPLALNTGDRAVMMTTKYVMNMLSSVRKEFGSGGDVIVYQEGRSYGSDVGAHYLKRLGSDFVRSNLFEVLQLYQALGWFKLEALDLNLSDHMVTVWTSGCFECEDRKSPKPYSHFVRGHLEGSVSAFLGERLECDEVKCIASGDQFCEFVLKPQA
jgi:predicted hydrocarbon binding protein